MFFDICTQGRNCASSADVQAAPPPVVEVPKVILRVVTIDNPDLRYVVGNDAIQMIETRKGMSDLEFERLVKQQLLAQ